MWDAIIGQLYCDRKALKACILTCKAWRRTSRSLLWRTLEILPIPGVVELPLHYRYLPVERPDIAQLVLVISVHLRFSELSWLSAFTSLTELTLNRCRTMRVSTTTASMIPGGLWMPTVTTLRLLWYSFPSLASFERLLACFPSITYLQAVDSYQGALDRTKGEEPPSVPVVLRRLRELHFGAGYLMQSFRRIIWYAGTSLERIHVGILTHTLTHEDLRDVLAFSQNTRLTEVSIAFDMYTLEEGWGEYLVAPLAQLNASHTELLRMVFHTTVCQYDPIPDVTRVWHDPGWPLGRELSRVFDEVPKVNVVFLHRPIHPDGVREARTALAHHLLRHFPGLRMHAQRLRYRVAWDRGLANSGQGDRVQESALIDDCEQTLAVDE